MTRLIAEDSHGFIDTTDGDEVYVHPDSNADRGFLRVLERGEAGPQASVVKPIGKHLPSS